MPVGAAIGVAGVGGNLAKGFLASEGADRQVDAANATAGLQQRGSFRAADAIGRAVDEGVGGLRDYGDTLGSMYAQTGKHLKPYIGYGRTAGDMLTSRLPELTQGFGDMFGSPDEMSSWLEGTPGYQFTLNQGLKAAQNSFSARGLGSSGPASKGAIDYATGLAGTTFQQQLQNYLATQAQNYNMLYGVTDLGADAAARYGTLGAQFGGIGAGIEQNIAGNLLTGGQAQAGAYMNAANAAANARIGGANAQAGAYGAMGDAAAGGLNALTGGYMFSQMYPGAGGMGGGVGPGPGPVAPGAAPTNPLVGVQSPIAGPMSSPYSAWGGYM